MNKDILSRVVNDNSDIEEDVEFYHHQMDLETRKADESTKNKLIRILSEKTKLLQNNVVVNEIGMPLKLVNPQKLLETGLRNTDSELSENPPDVFEEIEYNAIGNSELIIPHIDGIPIWENIPGESVENFSLFKIYRNMIRRSLYKLSQEVGIIPKKVNEIKNTYAWMIRIKAYDAYMDVNFKEEEKEIQRRVLGKHRELAGELTDLATSYLKNNIYILRPDVAVNLLDKAVAIERVSSNLNKNDAGVGGSKPASKLEQTMQNNGTMVNVNMNAGDGGSKKKEANPEEDRNNVASMLNLMNQIGVLENKNDDKNESGE